MEASATLYAPAKLNLTLEVLGRRADGFHGVRSLMVPIDLIDRLTIEPHEAFAFDCDDPDLRRDNLVERAAQVLGLTKVAVRITLHKVIPTQAGLGGGSSDAAALLLAAREGVFGEPEPRDDLATARALGSDVPFFLARTGAIVEGTGERVTAVGALPRWHAVVVKPPAGVSTAQAYAALDAHGRPQRPRAASVSLRALEALQRSRFDDLVELLQNDFQAVVAEREPTIAAALRALREAGARHPALTGSGSAVFALARDRAGRERILERLKLDPTYRVFGCAFTADATWR